MSRVGWIRSVVVVVAVAALEALCRLGGVSTLTLVPPTAMVMGLGRVLASSAMRAEILHTLLNVAVALVLAVIVGFPAGAALAAAPRVRRIVEPLLSSYYAIPVFVFYPFFVVVFGLNRLPQVAIGFLLAVVAMIVNTLNGFDQVPAVLWQAARTMGLGRAATVRRVVLPYAALYIVTGLKLAVSYAFIGVIAAEFILSGRGIGYQIAFAFNNFDSRVMYPLILLVLLVSTVLTLALDGWERRWLDRQGRHGGTS